MSSRHAPIATKDTEVLSPVAKAADSENAYSGPSQSAAAASHKGIKPKRARKRQAQAERDRSVLVTQNVRGFRNVSYNRMLWLMGLKRQSNGGAVVAVFL